MEEDGAIATSPLIEATEFLPRDGVGKLRAHAIVERSIPIDERIVQIKQDSLDHGTL